MLPKSESDCRGNECHEAKFSCLRSLAAPVGPTKRKGFASGSTALSIPGRTRERITCTRHTPALGEAVGADQALFFLNELVWSAAVIAAPILLATLAVGLVISVVQVATQIQEITLSYVPKLIATAIMLLLLGGWMLGRVTQFATSLYQSIPSLAN